MSCPQCFSGHVNPGTPKGRFDTVHNLRTYVAEPAAGKQAKGLIVVIPDAFGVDFVNNQILADHYASAGQYLVYLPDFMDGKAASVQCMINMAHMWDEKETWLRKGYYTFATIFEFGPFLYRNRFGVCWPRVTSFVRAVREDKSTASLPLGIAGFCWGGQYAIKLTHDKPETKSSSGRPLADAVFTAHPSSVTVPQDIVDVRGNLSIAIGDDDAVMGIAQVRAAQKILAEERKDVDSEVVIYPGAKHGFSIRASRWQPDSKETKQAREAEEQALAWFGRHLQAGNK